MGAEAAKAAAPVGAWALKEGFKAASGLVGWTHLYFNIVMIWERRYLYPCGMLTVSVRYVEETVETRYPIVCQIVDRDDTG